MNISRIALLADGIFAITMTILVLQLDIPQIVGPDIAASLKSGVYDLWPEILSYCGSFIILGIYWVAHYTQLAFVRKHTPMYLWMNVFFLMWISLLPFSTGLLGSYPGQQISLIIYGTNLVLCSLSLYLNWIYATHKNRLVDAKEVTEKIRQATDRRALAEPLFYLLGVLLTFVDVRLAIIAFIVPPILSFVPVLQQATARFMKVSA